MNSNERYLKELRFLAENSEDAKRLSASVTMHAVNGSAGKWAAYKLHDVTTDNTAYDTRKDAVRCHWPYQDYYFYVFISPGGMALEEAYSYLKYNRDLYEKGFRMPDPEDSEYIPTMPNTRQDASRQIRLLTK